MPVENTTSNRGYQLPAGANKLKDDVLRVIAAINAIDGDVATLVSSMVTKAPLTSPALTGTPTAPTPTSGDNSTKLATTGFVNTFISDFVGAAPAALDTLVELAAALHDNPDIIDELLASIAALDDKYIKVDGSQAFSPAEQGQARGNMGADVLSGYRNKIINGDFDIAERADGSPTFVSPVSLFYPCDRWTVYANGTGGAGSITRPAHTLGQTDVPGNPKQYLRWNVTSAASGQTALGITLGQRIKNVRTLAGKKTTLTVYAKGSGDFKFHLFQIFGTGGSPSSNVTAFSSSAQSLGGSWAKYQFVFDMPSISGKTLGTNGDDYLWFRVEAPINTTFDLNVSHVSLVEGDASAETDPFGAVDEQTQMMLCRHFYHKYGGTGIVSLLPYYGARLNAVCDFLIPLNPQMIGTPSLTASGFGYNAGSPATNAVGAYSMDGSGYMTIVGGLSAGVANTSNKDVGSLRLTAGTSWSGANGDIAQLYMGSGAWFAFDAEI